MASFLSRIFKPSTVKHVEGEYRPGPWETMAGIIPSSWPLNFWQLGYNPITPSSIAIVEACVSAHAQTIAMCPGDHWRMGANGKHERVTTSALSRLLRGPNAYQTQSDFLMNLVRCLYMEGNAYAVALRNERFEIVELHLMDPRTCGFRLSVNGDIFYHLGGNEVIERQFAAMGVPDALHAVPARDVLHVKLQTPRHPLIGESPLAAAASDIMKANALVVQSTSFFANQSRPSGVLSTDHILLPDQIDTLRTKWAEHSQGLNQGGVPILTAGLKWQGMSYNAVDSQVIEQLKLTDEHIALVFRMPLQILGIGGTPFASTEALMQSWLASGLGFALNHIEEAFGKMFGLVGWPNEYMGFDTTALLRSNFKERIEGLARGVQGGIYAPNEARESEGLPAAEFGDEPRVQQQVVPLSFWGDDPQPAPAAPAPAPAAPEGSDDAERALAAFKQRINETGWRDGQSVH